MSEDPFQELSPIEPEAQFKSELQPTTLDAGKNAQLTVTNEGQASESFTIDWGSEEDLLVFELWQPEGEEYVFKEARQHVLEVEPGAEQTVHFRAGLRKRPFFGGRAAYPFQVQVSSSTDDVLSNDGQVNERAIIPIWLLPVLLLLCLCLICSGILFFTWRGGGDDTAATQTAVAATVMANIVEQTLVAEGTHIAQMTAGAPLSCRPGRSHIYPWKSFAARFFCNWYWSSGN